MAVKTSITLNFWSKGMNSLLHPSFIQKGEYAYGENISCRGGIVQTRPGYNMVGSIPGQILQGLTIFTPRNSNSVMVVVVDGLVYRAEFQKYIFTRVDGIKLSPTAPRVHFAECLRSVQRNDDGTLQLITPTPVLIIQDGETVPAYWDGSAARHLDPTSPKLQTPIGTWMSWTASRLWLAVGSQVFVGDIGDPTSFSENAYIAERSGFYLPGKVTGLLETADEAGLLAFTRETTTVFKSNIHDRKLWGTTPDFQRVMLPKTGCVAGKTAVNQYGLAVWMSGGGLVALDVALNSQRSSRLLTMDSKMMRSKRLLSPEMDGACAVSYGNILMVSVPAGGRYNEQTWVMDQAPLEDDSGAAWVGVWSGIRPVEWATGVFGMRSRVFCASYDYTSKDDTRIHVWEAIRDDRKDIDGKIECQLQLGCSTNDKLMRFKYCEIEVTEMLGDVTLEIFMAGTRGPWFKIGEAVMQAEEGSLNKVIELNTDSIIETFRPQSRTVTSEEFSLGTKKCTPEMSGWTPGIDKGFSILLEWRGRMGVREVRVIFDPDSSPGEKGGCNKSEAGMVNAVNESGLEVTVG